MPQAIIEAEYARIEPPALKSNALTPMEMLGQAVSNGASIEVLDKLMTLQERWQANEARRAFDAAISAAKAEIPVIVKNASGHNNKRYADFSAIAKAVDPILSRHGLSYRFRSHQDERIHVTCVLSHSAGHSEETTLAGPADTSGSKNAIQAIGSTLSYLQRYSLVQMLGLASSEDDDGKTGGAGGTISDGQVAQLQNLIDDFGAGRAFLKFFKLERVEDLPASRFDEALAEINAFGARKRGVQE